MVTEKIGFKNLTIGHKVSVVIAGRNLNFSGARIYLLNANFWLLGRGIQIAESLSETSTKGEQKTSWKTF